jgi:DNA repair exonuclease SbcCD ATPase subunit
MPDDNKPTDGDDKNKPLTPEQIAAIAKKAEEALNAKDGDDDDKKKGKSDDGDDPNKDDDDFQLDPKNIDTDKTLKYIDKLKDENAKRRIAAKKAEKQLEDKTKQLAEATKALQDAAAQLADHGKKTEEQKAKERSDLENAQKTIDELNAKIGELNKSVEESQTQLAKTNRRVAIQDRENMIIRLVEEKGAVFASAWEKSGFIKSLTEMGDDGDFELNNDEVIYKTVEFIKTAPKKDEVKTPGPGPGNRKTNTPIGDEVQALLKIKGDLKPEQKARLDELLSMTGAAV